MNRERNGGGRGFTTVGANAAKVYDVLIIGGGILGAMTAWKLSRYDLRVLTVDRAYDVGEGSAKANSGILYPGIHPRENSLKGISCVQGNAMYSDICKDLDIPMKRVGSLYVTFHEGGEENLMKKYRRGLANGTPDMEIISGEEARRMEPLLSRKALKALYTPSTGIVSTFDLIVSLSEAAAQNGARFLFDCQVTGLLLPEGNEPVVVETTAGTLYARFVINTAGEDAASIEQLVREQDLIIRPRRGQFYIFDKQDGAVLNHVIYQAEETDEGGTLVAPTVEGNLIAGPTSENVREYANTDTTREGLAHVARVAKKILPDLDLSRVITNFAGVRANIRNVDKEHKDFVVRRSGNHMVSALGIKNPGMTSAPCLAERMIELLRLDGLKTEERAGFLPTLNKQKPFLQSSPEQQRRLFHEDPRYAKVVCRCEGITEGDIIHTLHTALPPKSLNGFRKRLRTGMGRCQGGFCTSRILEIVCRETGCAPEDFMKSTKGSPLVKGRLK